MQNGSRTPDFEPQIQRKKKSLVVKASRKFKQIFPNIKHEFCLRRLILRNIYIVFM